MTDPLIIYGNSNSRFSGVTSTLLSTLPFIRKELDIAVLGAHHLPEGVPILNFWQFVQISRQPRADGKRRIFHARRNDEMIQALIAKKLFRAPLIILFTSTAQRNHSRFTKWLIKQMDHVLSTCQAAASYLESPPDTLIPHGVNLANFSPPKSLQERQDLWTKTGLPGTWGIAMFGRVRPQKGTDVLVKAAIPILKKKPHPTIIIVGEITPKFASFHSALLQEIKEAGLQERILFLGKLPFERVQELFRASSLVSALSLNEGFGLTVLEAMASGCAVLASQAGAWEEIIEPEQDGFIVPCNDLIRTQEALNKALQDPERLWTMGVAGRDKVERSYQITNETERLIAYYHSLQP